MAHLSINALEDAYCLRLRQQHGLTRTAVSYYQPEGLPTFNGKTDILEWVTSAE